MPSSVQPLTRLCGLETEYAMHCEQTSSILTNRSAHSFTPKDIHFRDIVAELKKQSPTAPPAAEKTGVFLANGGAVWFESLLPGLNEGLFEACTPECNRPLDVVAASRAMDALLIKATDNLPGHPVRLLKNCTDDLGSSYGAQENYEVEAFGESDESSWNTKMNLLRLVTRVNFGLVAISFFLPLILITFFGPAVILAGATLWAWYCWKLGRRLSAGEVLYSLMSLVLMPKMLCVSLFYRSTKIGKTYQALTPFLVSRVIFSGAGSLDRKGRFVLGQKASTRNADWLVFSEAHQNAIFSFNPVFKQLARELSKPHECTAESTSRQRLSLSIGDSNMCQEAEYLRIATTTLVLDAIEAGAIIETPALTRTIGSLHKINRDPKLQVRVNTSRGQMTAIEIQQFYLNACRRYVESLDDAPEEAFDILKRWSDVLFQLQNNPDQLFGRIDWVTKRALMRHTEKQLASVQQPNQTSQTRKKCEFQRSPNLLALRKIDAKYHELSKDGYYYQLFDQFLTAPVLSGSSVEEAGRMPPLVTSAAQRSRHIREFGDLIEWITWDSVKLRTSARIIRFNQKSIAEMIAELPQPATGNSTG